MYINGKMRPVETIAGMRVVGREEKYERNKFSYDIW
jgi:hypothetical protein